MNLKANNIPTNPNMIDLVNLPKKRDIKFESKEISGKLPFGGPRIQRRLSLDQDHDKKVENSDLRNTLHEKFEGYLTRPHVELGN